MKRFKLMATKRTGKGYMVRRENQVPAVLYGQNMESISLSLPEAAINHFVNHGTANALIDLDIDGKPFTVMLKDLQRNRVKGEVVHLDFYAVDLEQKLTATVPVHLQGESVGVKAGGILQHQTREIEVRCLPADIPQGFDLDISSLNIGESRTVADLSGVGAIEVLTPETEVIVSVLAPRLAEEETEVTETEEAATPEQEAADEE